MRHRLPPSILREYDIRGTVGKTLAAADATAVGRAFGTVVRRAGGHRVAVGRDGRLSSPMLEAALVDGLLAAGVEEAVTGKVAAAAVEDMGFDVGLVEALSARSASLASEGL